MAATRTQRIRREELLRIPDTNECVRFAGYTNKAGYGRLGKIPAHRAVYEHHVGPIPPGLEIDHLCRNRWCVNWRHMEPVTHQENCRRSPLVGRWPRRKKVQS